MTGIFTRWKEKLFGPNKIGLEIESRLENNRYEVKNGTLFVNGHEFRRLSDEENLALAIQVIEISRSKPAKAKCHRCKGTGQAMWLACHVADDEVYLPCEVCNQTGQIDLAEERFDQIKKSIGLSS